MLRRVIQPYIRNKKQSRPVLTRQAVRQIDEALCSIREGEDIIIRYKKADGGIEISTVNADTAPPAADSGMNAIRSASPKAESPKKPQKTEMKARDRAFIEKMYRIIEEHLSDESFGVNTLAEELGMSRTSVFSKIKSLLGVSPQTFLCDYRLNKAMELLKSREMNISEVAYKVGFSTLTGFSRSFKNKFGIPPSSI